MDNMDKSMPYSVKNRREFLKYMVGSTVASVAMGYIFPLPLLGTRLTKH
jgi:hypothetical protein